MISSISTRYLVSRTDTRLFVIIIVFVRRLVYTGRRRLGTDQVEDGEVKDCIKELMSRYEREFVLECTLVYLKKRNSDMEEEREKG